MFALRHTRPLLLAALVALLLAPLAAPRAARADDTPNISLQELPDIVQPGQIMGIEIRVENWTDYDLTAADVKINYNPDLLTLTGSRLNDEDDWVSEANPGDVTVTFGEIEDDEARQAVVEFRVSPRAADSTRLTAPAEYSWALENGRTEEGTTDDYEILILSPEATGQVTITPQQGPPGTVYQIRADRFWPGEVVVTWLNTPTGVQDTDLYDEASNPGGTVQLTFDSSGLAPGDYSMVLLGQDSQHEYVVPFTVLPR